MLDGVLRRRVLGLVGHRAVAEHAADVDDGAAAAPADMLGGDERAVDDAPVVDLELAPLILDRKLTHIALERDRGIVHPGVDAAEGLGCDLGDALDVLAFRHVRRDDNRLPAAPDAFAGHLPQRVLVAGREHEPGAALGGHLRGGAADAARGAGDDDDLLFERLQRDAHRGLLRAVRNDASTSPPAAGSGSEPLLSGKRCLTFIRGGSSWPRTPHSARPPPRPARPAARPRSARPTTSSPATRSKARRCAAPTATRSAPSSAS